MALPLSPRTTAPPSPTQLTAGGPRQRSCKGAPPRALPVMSSSGIASDASTTLRSRTGLAAPSLCATQRATSPKRAPTRSGARRPLSRSSICWHRSTTTGRAARMSATTSKAPPGCCVRLTPGSRGTLKARPGKAPWKAASVCTPPPAAGRTAPPSARAWSAITAAPPATSSSAPRALHQAGAPAPCRSVAATARVLPGAAFRLPARTLRARRQARRLAARLATAVAIIPCMCSPRGGAGPRAPAGG
ncbi:hypothetical protein [Massilia sp. Dwa41.01b]|uniref:hypothetical protein n=1 Tax=Massilia sp. Dwa41.01b TaxID=2709302 RepID=UPI001E5605FB|nr:hypothetical protein [Massilia sp. Dwa41.01b]